MSAIAGCRRPSTEAEDAGDDIHVFTVAVELARGTRFSLFLSNNRPGGGQSHVVLRRLLGSMPFGTVVRRWGEGTEAPPDSSEGWIEGDEAWFDEEWFEAEPPPADGGPHAIADESERVRELEAQIASLMPLADLTPLARLLREHRPAIYQNAAGDFQLMAREHWFTLRGYPELEMFSMNVDGLFEAIAHAAGLCEQVWAAPLCVYHLEHEKGSGWTPEGEAQLKARIAASGINWLDSGAVQILSTYMEWLRRPMIFNRSAWGMRDEILRERTLRAAAPARQIRAT